MFSTNQSTGYFCEHYWYPLNWLTGHHEFLHADRRQRKEKNDIHSRWVCSDFPNFCRPPLEVAPRLSDRFSDVENILGSKISGSEYLLYFCQYTTVFFNPQYPQKQSMGHIDFLHADRHQRNKEIEILAKFIAELLEDVVNLVVLKIV